MSKFANSRTTIGLFIEWTNNPYHLAIIRGIREAVIKHKVNLIIYVGGAINSPIPFELNRNIVYTIADPYQIDGLIISAASLMRSSTTEELSAFCRDFSFIPLVTIGEAVSHIPFVGTDNTSGMQDLMHHLIHVHNYKKFAFFKGPENSHDSEERLHVYKNTLIKEGLEYSDEYIFNGYFMYEHAVGAMEEMLNAGKKDRDVIVCANDDMAIGVLSVLKDRNISVPQDIAVVGFDNQEITQFLSTPLTSVSQKVQLQGFTAAETCISLIKGEKVNNYNLIQSCFIKRHSCGCPLYPEITYNEFNNSHKDSTEKINRESVINSVVAILKNQKYLNSKNDEELAESAIAGLLKAINSLNTDLFLKEMERFYLISGSFTLTHHSITGLCNIIRQAIIAYIDDKKKQSVFDPLIAVATARQADKQNRNIQYGQKIEERETDGLLRTIEDLVAAMDLEDMAKLLTNVLPKIGINNFFLSLYENPESDKSLSVSQLIYKFTEEGKIYHPVTRSLFPTHRLCPDYYIPDSGLFSLYIEPLLFGQTQLGYCGFEYLTTGETSWYSVRRLFIAIALKAAFYMQKVKFNFKQYEADVAKQTKELSTANESLTRLYNAQIKAEAEVRQLNEQLERRVEERTGQLGEMNKELLKTLHRLETTQAKLVEVEKMAALGSLVAGIAHEINTPVGISVTAASHMNSMAEDILRLFENNKLKRSDLQKYFTTSKEASSLVLTNLKRAYELIRNFKKIAVDQSNEEKRKIYLREYLDEILLSLQPKLKKTNHKIRILCGNEIIIFSHAGAIYQIVTNLIINSLIHGFEYIEQGIITIKIRIYNDTLVFKYYDNGTGISKENLKKIFNPFYTSKRYEGGTGLGLHLVYNIVTQTLKGTIKCISRIGQGTLFRITIPITKKDEMKEE